MTEETNRKLARLREERDELLLQDGTVFQDQDGAAPTRIDRADRLIRATPDEVYAALLHPTALEACLPPDGATPVQPIRACVACRVSWSAIVAVAS